MCDDSSKFIIKGELLRENKLSYSSKGTKKGITGLVLDYREEGFSQEKILGKLEKHFDLSREQARAYYEQYAQ